MTRTTGTRCRLRCCSTARSTGRTRKLLAQASRNGWFFVLDRTNGKHIVSSEYVKTNWAQGRGCQRPADSESGQAAAARWRAGVAESGRRGELAAAELQSGHGTVLRQRRARLQCLLPLRRTTTSPKAGAATTAADFPKRCCRPSTTRPARLRWSHKWPGNGGARRSGLLSTAGKLLFAGDTASNFVALDPATGTPLWHAGLHSRRDQRSDHV